MKSVCFVESLLSFVITHYISFFTNCSISTPKLKGIIKPGASQPGLSLGCELPVTQRPAFGGGGWGQLAGAGPTFCKESGFVFFKLRTIKEF